MIEKSQLKDSMGRPLTQGLFIEIKYDPEFAVYTLEEQDKEYKGEVYPSLKRLYLEMEDPTEYEFAVEHLLGWNHWKRLNNNSLLSKHFVEWREELEVKLRSKAIQKIMDKSEMDGDFSASKWLADRGWEKRGAGRPSKADIEHRHKIEERIRGEFDEDFERLGLDGDVAERSLQ